MLLDWFFPPRCLSCRDLLKREKFLCGVCRGRWPSPPEAWRPVCASVDRVHAAGLYRGLLEDLIVRLKYRKEERLAVFLGDRMAEALAPEASFDVVLPVPLHLKRLRERGFNQAAWLACRVAKRRQAPVNPFVLEKIQATRPQAELSGTERRTNLRSAFRVADPAAVDGKRILLVDDVYTTGATVEAAARVLKKAGAEGIEVLVAARAE